MLDYKCEIIEGSKDLTPRERVQLKMYQGFPQLHELTKTAPLIISVADYAVLSIHNERSKGDTDYIKYVITDRDGNHFVTGSKSFFDSFMQIWTEMNGEEFDIEVMRYPSKTRQGAEFITCTIV